MQKICCQGNRGESEREAEIAPEYQDCRRRALRSSTLSASLQQIFNPCTTLVLHLKADFECFKCLDSFWVFFCVCWPNCHTKAQYRLQFISLFFTSGPLISSVSLRLYLYIDWLSLFSLPLYLCTPVSSIFPLSSSLCLWKLRFASLAWP